MQGAMGEHAVEVALEDGRRPEPPERKMEDQPLGAAELVDLGADIAGQGAGLAGSLLGLQRIEVRMRARQAMEPGRFGRLEAEPVKVRPEHAVPEAFARGAGAPRPLRVERERAGVRKHDERCRHLGGSLRRGADRIAVSPGHYERNSFVGRPPFKRAVAP